MEQMDLEDAKSSFVGVPYSLRVAHEITSQVVRITAGKCYGDCDRSPGLRISIRRLD